MYSCLLVLFLIFVIFLCYILLPFCICMLSTYTTDKGYKSKQDVAANNSICSVSQMVNAKGEERVGLEVKPQVSKIARSQTQFT